MSTSAQDCPSASKCVPIIGNNSENMAKHVSNDEEAGEFSEVEFEAEIIDCDPEGMHEVIRRNKEIGNEILQIINDCKLETESKYEPAREDGDRNLTLTIFYRYFFTKHVANLQKKEANSGNLKKYASIFPFKINLTPSLDKWTSHTLNIVKNDDEFLAEIESFLVDYTECSNHRNLIDVFLANILNFKLEHFKNISYVQLLRVSVIGKSEGSWRKHKNRLHLCDYLENFPHLNMKGVSWYRNFQNEYNDVCKCMGREEEMLPEKGDDYFLNLPEINCCELLLLSESDYYRDHREMYIKLFKKYIIFFWHASLTCDNQVFFIDDTLFACLKWYKRFKIYKEDVMSLLWEISMMTLVHRRKFRLSKVQFKPILDENNLRNLVKYAGEIDGIESAVIYYEEPKYTLCFKTFLLVDDVIYWIHYRTRKTSDKATSNLGMILKSALLSRDIKKLVLHNAGLGEDITYDISSKRNEIRAFILKYHKMGKKFKNQHFCIRDMKYYFENVDTSI